MSAPEAGSGNSYRISQCLQDCCPGQLLPVISAGIVLGILNLTLAISFGALIFSGELADSLCLGIGLLLFSACILGLVVALFSSFRGMIAVPQDAPAAILALIAATLAGTLAGLSNPEATFMTIVACMAVTALVTGVTLWLMGVFRLGRFIRFLPYPVIGGFLAGTGWLLVTGALSMMTDMPLTFDRLSVFLQTPMLIKWLPGMVFGVLLWGILRRYQSDLIIPSMLLISIVLFYLVLFVAGISPTDAGGRGWLMGPFPESSLWKPFLFSAFRQAHWIAIFSQTGSIATIVMLSIISLLLNVSGIELAVQQEIDLNRELRAAGLANVLTGLGGGLAGYHTLGDTLLGHKMAGKSRLPGIISAVLCGAALLFGMSLLSFFPKFIGGGLLFFLGLNFLIDWVYESWFRLSFSDYLLILLIVGVIGTVGFLEGVSVGIIAAVVVFIVKYSRVNVVKHRLSGETYQSNVDRAIPYQRLLKEQGSQLLILKLQGYLFFGTADGLLTQIRERIHDRHLTSLRFLVCDFAIVTGLDSSALISFTKMTQLAATQHFTIVLTQLSPQILRQFEREGVLKDAALLRVFSDLDHGVEWCEEQILRAEEESGAAQPIPGSDLESIFHEMLDALDQQTRFESLFERLSPYLERQDVQKGRYLIRQGETSDALYFIESAQVTAQLENEDGNHIRLQTIGMGKVVGELGFYLKRPATAAVIVREPGVVYRLSIATLRDMHTQDPSLTAFFHEFMAYLLSERLANTNATLQAVIG